jgi:hypothetical protein
VDYASFLKPNVKVLGDRNMKTAVTDLRDSGPYVAKIITDDRTVNKFVLCYRELLSQEEIIAKMKELSGEKIERQYVRFLPDLFFSLWILYSMDKRMKNTDSPSAFRYRLSNFSRSLRPPEHPLNTTSPT